MNCHCLYSQCQETLKQHNDELITAYKGLHYYNNMGEISWGREFGEGTSKIPKPMDLYHKKRGEGITSCISSSSYQYLKTSCLKWYALNFSIFNK